MSPLARILFDLRVEHAIRSACLAICRRHPVQRDAHAARLADIEAALRLHASVLIGAGL